MNSLKDKLRPQLSRDEGRKASAYQDHEGNWTIGVGHLIDAKLGGTLPDFIIDDLLNYDINVKLKEVLTAFPWASTLSEPRLGVLVNMCFNMGIDNLRGFKLMLAAMEKGDWQEASIQCADPDYVKDVGQRAHRLAKQLLTNEWQ